MLGSETISSGRAGEASQMITVDVIDVVCIFSAFLNEVFMVEIALDALNENSISCTY